MGGISENLKRLDTHSSVSKEFRVYTAQGAFLSVVTVLMIAYLVMAEILFNFQITLQERVHVNATSSRGLEMEFDLSLPHVPCSRLNVDSNDPTGQAQSLHLDQQHHVWKHRIRVNHETGERTFLGDRSKIELGSTLLTEQDLRAEFENRGLGDSDSGNNTLVAGEAAATADIEMEVEECGSCYGAGEEGECCDTCDDVKRAYKRRGWVIDDAAGVKQCQQDDARKASEGADEGCNIHGKVALSSGGGNLHVAPGREIEGSTGNSLFDMLLASFHQWNVSHTLHKVRFGPDYPAAINQLDGHERAIVDTYGMYQYYIQVVPTQYTYINGTTILSNQYSVTEHLRHVNPGSSRGLPGVFFFYEVSPLHVEIAEVYRKGWVSFLTSVCAVVGGVVTVLGLVDQYLFQRTSGSRDLAR